MQSYIFITLNKYSSNRNLFLLPNTTVLKTVLKSIYFNIYAYSMHSLHFYIFKFPINEKLAVINKQSWKGSE